MEFSLKEIIQLAVQGGIGVVMLVVWYYTRKDGNKQADDAKKQTDRAIDVAQKAVDAATRTTTEAFQKHAILADALFQHMRDEQEDRSLLTGILDRLTIKLDTPAQCPLLMSGKKFRLEVTE